MRKEIDYRAYDHPMGLVLTRKLGERIELDDGNSRIVITLLGCNHGRASIGVFTNQKTFKITRLDAPTGAQRRDFAGDPYDPQARSRYPKEEGNGPDEPKEV